VIIAGGNILGKDLCKAHRKKSALRHSNINWTTIMLLSIYSPQCSTTPLPPTLPRTSRLTLTPSSTTLLARPSPATSLAIASRTLLAHHFLPLLTPVTTAGPPHLKTSRPIQHLSKTDLAIALTASSLLFFQAFSCSPASAEIRMGIIHEPYDPR